MILFPAFRTLLLVPPKCASTTLHDALGRPPFEGFVNGWERWHEAAVPYPCLEWRTVAVIRSPYARAVSLWRHQRRHDPALGNWTFADFVRAVLLEGPPAWSFYRQTLLDWLEPARLDAVVRVESLVADLKALGLSRGTRFDLPRLNESAGGDWRLEYDAATARAVREWASGVFEAFGYPREFVKS